MIKMVNININIAANNRLNKQNSEKLRILIVCTISQWKNIYSMPKYFNQKLKYETKNNFIYNASHQNITGAITKSRPNDFWAKDRSASRLKK